MRFCKRRPSSCIQPGVSMLMVAVLVSGCGIFESKKADYRTVQKTRPLDVPPELSAPAKDDRYAVSELGSKGTTFSSYSAERSAVKGGVAVAAAEPKPAANLPKSDKVRLERDGAYRWVVLEGTPTQTWPLLKRFVEVRGLQVKAESAELGLIETDWAEKAIYTPEGGLRGMLSKALGTIYSTAERDKFRIRVEPGKDATTSEVFISHRGVEEVYVTQDKTDTRWQPRPSSSELEAEMLGLFMQSLGVDEKKVTEIVAVSVAAAPSDRARLVDSGGKLSVDIDERFDRAWRRVGLALDRNGFTVEDRDRAKGIYFVRYDDPLSDKKKAGKSWTDSLAFWRDDKASAELDKTPFRVTVTGAGEELTKAAVQDGSGTSLNNETARKILDIIRNELK